ncbi:IclR family transcriptional regulator [Pseudomonas sp. RIT-PI-q]|uniref:IclR family transcriptional regulator n=1 Tax=Pseudomonas sp. RIT-PI-q TaxID=1690247 RepID=UPI0006CC5380|nr:IclR family transcriptional regulator [Pseudomonas sp. RIT-PI-q]KPG96036.1 IclR family transcriptional regulator [Pseudomonas sp. RIT-PI-q]
MTSPEDSPLFITALSKGLAIVSVFRAGSQSMSLGAIVEATGFNKSTIQRSVFTLEALGYLFKEPDTKRFRLTPKSLDLGAGYLQSSDLIERANPYLHELNRSVEESCNLLERSGLDMIYVARFPSHKQIPLHIQLGQHLPIFCTAAGRAYLCALPESEGEAILVASNRVSYTAGTVIDIDQIRQLVAEARQDGYAHSNEEFYAGDIGVAAPVVNVNGYPLGAVNISVPFSRWTFEQARSELAPKVMNTARAISRAAGSLRSMG